jgi:ubiquinone/menaquinone biosynthesis C-methylase UbiE
MSFFDNTRKPAGRGGRLMIAMMNAGHAPVSRWGLKHLELPEDARVLDCGCGGGINLRRLFKKCPRGVVQGIDYAPLSVAKSQDANQKAIAGGRCEVRQGSVDDLPFEPAEFDGVTAFETVYFWPGLTRCFGEVYRVLKPGGVFLICNETNGDTDKDDKWTKLIDGMRIYNDMELKEALEQAGFRKIEIDKKHRWICVTAQK